MQKKIWVSHAHKSKYYKMSVETVAPPRLGRIKLLKCEKCNLKVLIETNYAVKIG